MNPPVLMPPVPGRPLILYMTIVDESMGCKLGQHDESRKKERAVYYLSKKFMAYEMNYSLLEKNVLCFSIGVPPSKTIYAEPYHLVDIQDGPG